MGFGRYDPSFGKRAVANEALRVRRDRLPFHRAGQPFMHLHEEGGGVSTEHCGPAEPAHRSGPLAKACCERGFMLNSLQLTFAQPDAHSSYS